MSKNIKNVTTTGIENHAQPQFPAEQSATAVTQNQNTPHFSDDVTVYRTFTLSCPLSNEDAVYLAKGFDRNLYEDGGHYMKQLIPGSIYNHAMFGSK